MKKKLEDYLHLYLPVAVELNNGGSKVYNRTAVAVGNMDDEFRYVTLRMGKGAKSFTHSILFSEPDRIKPILRPLSDMTDAEINNVCSILLSRETTCGKIWRSEERDFIIATFKQEKPLPPYDNNYKSMSMGIYIKNNCQVDYKWSYYTKDNCEGSCGITTEPLHNHNEITRYLLSKHFDLFGLIESGLAIDKTKTPTNETS